MPRPRYRCLSLDDQRASKVSLTPTPGQIGGFSVWPRDTGRNGFVENWKNGLGA